MKNALMESICSYHFVLPCKVVTLHRLLLANKDWICYFWRTYTRATHLANRITCMPSANKYLSDASRYMHSSPSVPSAFMAFAEGKYPAFVPKLCCGSDHSSKNHCRHVKSTHTIPLAGSCDDADHNSKFHCGHNQSTRFLARMVKWFWSLMDCPSQAYAIVTLLSVLVFLSFPGWVNTIILAGQIVHRLDFCIISLNELLSVFDVSSFPGW